MTTDPESIRRNLSDALPAIILTATPDFRMDFANVRAVQVFGIQLVSDDEFAWTDLVHPDDLDSVLAAWAVSKATGQLYRHEHRIRMIGGQYGRFRGEALPLKDPNGEVLRWYGVLTPLEAVAPRILRPGLRPKVDIYPFRDDSGMLRLLEVGMWNDRPDDPAAKRHPLGFWYRIVPVDGV
jgi:hypothetical protein